MAARHIAGGIFNADNLRNVSQADHGFVVHVDACTARDIIKNHRHVSRFSNGFIVLEVQVIGSFNSESLFTPLQAENSEQSLLEACGRGYFVVGILGVNQEPTNHALRDIAAFKAGLEKWGRKMVLLFPNEAQYKKFRPDEFPGLPSTIIYGIDTSGIAAQIAEAMKLRHKETLPVFIIADTFNRVVFVSQGYTIGLGEQLMKTVEGL